MRPWDHFAQFETADEHRLLLRWLALGGDRDAYRRLALETRRPVGSLKRLGEIRHWGFRAQKYAEYLGSVMIKASESLAKIHGEVLAESLAAHRAAVRLISGSVEKHLEVQERTDMPAIEAPKAAALALRSVEAASKILPPQEEAPAPGLDLSDLTLDELRVIQSIQARQAKRAE